jgi:hypothetical protein
MLSGAWRSTIDRVIALLAAGDLRAYWEFPGYLRISVPDGPADLAYGLEDGVWCGHAIKKTDSDACAGWDAPDLPRDADAVSIARVLSQGVAAVSQC